MARARTLLLFLVLSAALLIAGLQLFLAYGLTDSLRQRVVPMARDRWNIELGFDRLSVNLFNGSMSLRGLTVSNPPGFDPAGLLALRRLKLTVGLRSLLRGGVATIQKAALRDGVLRVERDAEGRLNMAPILEAMHAAAVSGAPGAGADAGRAESGAAPGVPAGMPDLLIRRVDIQTRLHYTDRQAGEPPFRASIDLRLRLANVGNVGRADTLSGALTLTGSILGTPTPCAFDLNGRIAPIRDPTSLSFDLSGSMQALPLSALGPMARRAGFEAGSVVGTMTLVARQGVFDPERSALRLNFRDIAFDEAVHARFRGLPLPDEFAVTVPIRGTLTRPEVDLAAAFENTLKGTDEVGRKIQDVLQGPEAP